MPVDRRSVAAIPLVATFVPFWAGVERLTRRLLRKLSVVAALAKVMHEVPNVVTEALVAFR